MWISSSPESGICMQLASYDLVARSPCCVDARKRWAFKMLSFFQYEARKTLARSTQLGADSRNYAEDFIGVSVILL